MRTREPSDHAYLAASGTVVTETTLLPTAVGLGVSGHRSPSGTRPRGARPLALSGYVGICEPGQTQHRPT